MTEARENPIEHAIEDDAVVAKRGGYGILSIVVAAFFGLFYAYDVWEAVSTMIALPAFYEAYGYGVQNVPWWLLWIGIAVPVLAFVAAFFVGRRSNVLVKALVFLTGLAVAAALGMGAIALEDVLRPVVLVLPGG